MFFEISTLITVLFTIINLILLGNFSINYSLLRIFSGIIMTIALTFFGDANVIFDSLFVLLNFILWIAGVVVGISSNTDGAFPLIDTFIQAIIILILMIKLRTYQTSGNIDYPSYIEEGYGALISENTSGNLDHSIAMVSMEK